jgi:DmsE family decaheme c-type cytochrome
LLKKKQPDLCFSCHQTIQALFSLPSHHRVPEGQIKCTDCHDTHGTMNRPLLRKANFEVCVGCHVEKRGPYVYEHPAAKVEGYTACHSPHGTVERHLLLRREGRFLCLQCHVNPQAVNVPHSRLSFQTRGECVRCHAVIHGSNISCNENPDTAALLFSIEPGDGGRRAGYQSRHARQQAHGIGQF